MGEEAFKGEDEWKVANGRIQKTSDQVTFHEGTHQLMHEYANLFRETPLKDDVQSVRERQSMWFDEGIAEFMGAVEYDEDKIRDLVGVKWHHSRMLVERVDYARKHRALAKKWTIAEMIKPNNNGDLLQQSQELASPQQAVTMAVLFYARSWALTHFSWFYDNGKYRESFLEYMERFMDGEPGADAMVQAYGGSDPEAWLLMEKEFEWYWEEFLGRRTGQIIDKASRMPTGRWWIPETEPPEGTYDPDDDTDDYGGYDDEEEGGGDEE